MAKEYIEREAALKFKLTANSKKITVAQAVADAIAAYIESIPAADVRPVVHGEWIDDKSTIVGDIIERNCSICGQRMTSCIERLMSYCPNCGALMDKEGDGDV